LSSTLLVAVGGLQSHFTDVRCIDESTAAYPAHHAPLGSDSRAGYAVKAYALYITSFDEVLMLDSGEDGWASWLGIGCGP
jgi:hypothetical protein